LEYQLQNNLSSGIVEDAVKRPEYCFEHSTETPGLDYKAFFHNNFGTEDDEDLDELVDNQRSKFIDLLLKKLEAGKLKTVSNDNLSSDFEKLLPKKRLLDLSMLNLTSDECNMVTNCLGNVKDISNFIFSTNPNLSDNDIKLLLDKIIENNKNTMEKLTFYNLCLIESTCESVRELITTNLQTLSIIKTPITEKGLLLLSENLETSMLKNLHLIECNLTVNHFNAIGNLLLKNSQLVEFNLNNNNFESYFYKKGSLYNFNAK